MTKQIPISAIQNKWFDSEQVDSDDLTTEQNYNNSIQSSILNNHFGTGVLLGTLATNVIFDSLVTSGIIDGYGLGAQSQPTDKNFGNQLAITLSNSWVAGKKTIKIAIVGLDFQDNLQYDTFTFKQNETQYTKKHYTNILSILINDFKGTSTQSFNLGGKIVISEAPPFTISRDTIMVAQDQQPNLFWRDFYATTFASLTPLLQSALPNYNINNLNIMISPKENQIIYANDVTTQIGQKFQATTNNIQKVTLLLSVQNTNTATDLAWHGDLVVSIYPLQTSIDCPTDIVPSAAIEFPPSNIPLAQVSFNYNSFQAIGIQLDGNPQPIDFIFSNTSVANGTTISPAGYYMVAVKRSGSADKCDILIAAGANTNASIGRTTIFTGSSWVDIVEDNLWFRVYTDAAKITDGQGYDAGFGLIIPKTTQATITSTVPNTTTTTSTTATIDYNLSAIPFTGNSINTAVIQGTTQNSDLIQDQRTGNSVYARQQLVPTVQLLNPIDLANLELVSEPFAIGIIQDSNQKIFDVSTATITAALHTWGFVSNELVIKIVTDKTDPRYDSNVNSLVSYLLNGAFTDAKIIPDLSNPSVYYRIADATLCTMMYGDVDGNGIIDDNDVVVLNTLLGANLNISPPLNSQITTNGVHTTVVNGYEMYVNPFAAASGLTWQVVNPMTTAVITSGSDGIILPNPINNALATFESGSTNFSTITGLTTYDLVIYGSSLQANDGYFTILNVDINSNNVIDIRKLYIDTDVIKQIYRADIDGYLSITSNDGYYLQSYVNRTIPFPPTTMPSLKIGTTFQTLTLTIDPFLYTNFSDGYTDRTDDFPYNQINRATTLHATQDLFINDGYIQNHNFLTSPVTCNIVKQLAWEDYLVATLSNPRPVPSVFTAESGLIVPDCNLDGIVCENYPAGLTFDPGTIDFYTPNDLIVGGDIKNSDGYFYKVDYEVGTVILEIPPGLMNGEHLINVFDTFVADYNNTGITRLGYTALRYADCSTVKSDDIFMNRVRFGVSMQSYSPLWDGYTVDGYDGDIIDGKMGVNIDPTTGILRLNFTNIFQDPVLLTLITKVQVTVHLKKAGFNNQTLVVSSDKVGNLFNLIT